MRSACPGYMKSKSKMNRKTGERKDALTDGVSQARVQTVGAPHQNLTAGHIGNPSPHATQQQKFSLHSGKFWAFLAAPSSKQANTKVNWHNLWHHHQQREVAGRETLIETWFFRHCFMAKLVSVLKLTRVREKSSVISDLKRKFENWRIYFIKYWLAFY